MLWCKHRFRCVVCTYARVQQYNSRCIAIYIRSGDQFSLLTWIYFLCEDLASNGTRKLQCRSASAHQLTINKPGNNKFDDAFKSKFPRTYSAAAVVCSKENMTSDGFDISQLEQDIVEEGEVRSAGTISFYFTHGFVDFKET